MDTIDVKAPLVIGRPRRWRTAIVAGAVLIAGLVAVSDGQSATASAANIATTQAGPQAGPQAAPNPAEQAAVPQPFAMKASPTVKATPYWGEPSAK